MREICRRAGANIAAVNYHFGDKETLYAEVLRYAHGKALEKYPPLLDVAADAPPEKKLRAFVNSLLLRIFDKGPTAWHGKLMSREMIEPTAALDSLVEERIRPMAGQLWRDRRGNSRLPAERRARAAVRFQRRQPVHVLSSLPPGDVRGCFPSSRALDAAGIERLADAHHAFFAGGDETFVRRRNVEFFTP